MSKNNKVDTAQKGQTATKNKIPTGKITVRKETEARKKAREEQYRNFRINALKRRCKRMGFDDAKIEEYVKKLIEQLKAPKEYDILIMFNINDGAMMRQALDNAKIKYKFNADTYFFVQGNQDVLAKIREIAPPNAKIHPYARKMEPVIPREDMEVIKKPSNNTAEKKAAAKTSKKISGGSYRYARRQKGRAKTMADIHRASRYVKRNLKKGEKIDVKKVFKIAEERKKGGAGTTIQLNAKKSSTGSKKASTNIKKAA